VAEAGHRLRPGDRVRVTVGYDGEDSAWLQGGDGYTGVVSAMTAKSASVELDEELELEAGEGRTWQDFGTGSASAVREVQLAKGRWLILFHGWEGMDWRARTAPLQVGLCSDKPDLYAVPEGGGAGCWVESHATCVLIEPAP
jgi:hypothetical protein